MTLNRKATKDENKRTKKEDCPKNGDDPKNEYNNKVNKQKCFCYENLLSLQSQVERSNRARKSS